MHDTLTCRFTEAAASCTWLGRQQRCTAVHDDIRARMAPISGNQPSTCPQESSRGSLRRLQSLLAPPKKAEYDNDEEEDQDFGEPELDRCTDEEDDEECEERTGNSGGGMTEVEPACQELGREGQGGGAQIAWGTTCKSSGGLQASLLVVYISVWFLCEEDRSVQICIASTSQGAGGAVQMAAAAALQPAAAYKAAPVHIAPDISKTVRP